MPQTLLLMILVYVMTYVHIVASEIHDIGHEKGSCCAALHLTSTRQRLHSMIAKSNDVFLQQQSANWGEYIHIV